MQCKKKWLLLPACIVVVTLFSAGKCFAHSFTLTRFWQKIIVLVVLLAFTYNNINFDIICCISTVFMQLYVSKSWSLGQQCTTCYDLLWSSIKMYMGVHMQFKILVKAMYNCFSAVCRYLAETWPNWQEEAKQKQIRRIIFLTHWWL